MLGSPRVRLGLSLATALLAGCGSTGPAQFLDVGSDEGGILSLASGDAGRSSALDARIEQGGVTVTFVTLTCSGPCADVLAVAAGGNPPYSFAWDDGSTSPSRHVCPASSTTYDVKVTDTGTSGELGRAPETARVALPANVIACPDGGAPAVDGGACDPDASGVTPPAPSTVEVDANGSEHYVAGGASLPPGRYRAEWVDGCMRYAVGGPMFGWDVNDPAAVFPGPVGLSMNDSGYCVLVSDPATIVAELPGVTGFGTSDYPSCVAQVPMTAPVEFSFGGGKLGVVANDFGAGDDVNGESAGGVSPTWRITFLSPCP